MCVWINRVHSPLQLMLNQNTVDNKSYFNEEKIIKLSSPNLPLWLIVSFFSLGGTCNFVPN